MLQDERDNEIIEGVSEQICLGAGDFSVALLDLCIVSDLAEFVSLPSTYRTACCNLVQQYFSNECKGTCVSQDAMQQTNVWLMVCRVNLPPLEVCTDEQLVLSAPMAEDAILPALKAVQEAQEVLQEAQQEEQEQNGDKEKEMDDEEQQQSSPSPQLQKDPVVIASSDETQDSLNSLALDNAIFGEHAPPSPAPLIELFSSGQAEMRAALRSTPPVQVETRSTYILPQESQASESQQLQVQQPQQVQDNVVAPVSIPILPQIDLAGFSQLKILEAIQSMDAIKLFASAVVVNPQLVQELQKPGFFTVFAPTDAAVVEFISTRSLVDEQGVSVWRDAVIHHFVADKITISSIQGQKPLLMFDNQETTLERISTSAAIGGDLVLLKGCCADSNFARVVVADVPVANGMLHVVDRILVPQSGFP